MFIKLDNNNKIVESATFKVNNDFIETKKKIEECLVFENDNVNNTALMAVVFNTVFNFIC